MPSPPPPGFRYIDVPTHRHPPWRSAAIRRWFVGRPGWEFVQIFHDDARRLFGL